MYVLNTQKINLKKKERGNILNMFHTGIPAEHLSTDPAGVGLDPGVKPHVACKHVAPGK
jgi:hypothetical protein